MPDRVRAGLKKGDLVWRRPNRTSLSNLLHNPIYAGAYVYGRRSLDNRKKKPGKPATGRTVEKPSEWEILIKDKIPACITWEQYERNLRQLTANSVQGVGVPRGGTFIVIWITFVVVVACACLRFILTTLINCGIVALECQWIIMIRFANR